MKIRDATVDDAPAAADVMKRSISELCAADHHDDPIILARWLANKTPAIVRSWITQTGSSVLVAVEDETVIAVGSVTDDGEIGLNYVSPNARFQGVSRALLAALEARAMERGAVVLALTSTETARRFYGDRGYAEEGLPLGAFGTSSGYRMKKRAAPVP